MPRKHFGLRTRPVTDERARSLFGRLCSHALDKLPAFFVPHPLYAPTKDEDLSVKEQELIHFLRKIGDDDRENKVMDLLEKQAKRVADVIIDADVRAYHDEVKADLRARAKLPEGKRSP